MNLKMNLLPQILKAWCATFLMDFPFLRSANVGMVRYRRTCIKKVLPIDRQLLCSDTVEFTGANLFGNSLSADIKEVSELNKISRSVRGSARGFRSRFRGFPRFVRGRQIEKMTFLV